MNGIVDVQEGAPTPDQLTSILEYLGPSKAGSVIQDATGTTDALRKFKQNESLFQRPVTVDWNNGRAGKLFMRTREESDTGLDALGALADTAQLLVRTRARS